LLRLGQSFRFPGANVLELPEACGAAYFRILDHKVVNIAAEPSGAECVSDYVEVLDVPPT
jgi:hypothetical protein